MKIYVQKVDAIFTFAVDAVDVVSALNVKTNLLSASKNSLTRSKKVAVGTNVKTPIDRNASSAIGSGREHRHEAPRSQCESRGNSPVLPHADSRHISPAQQTGMAMYELIMEPGSPGAPLEHAMCGTCVGTANRCRALRPRGPAQVRADPGVGAGGESDPEGESYPRGRERCAEGVWKCEQVRSPGTLEGPWSLEGRAFCNALSL